MGSFGTMAGLVVQGFPGAYARLLSFRQTFLGVTIAHGSIRPKLPGLSGLPINLASAKGLPWDHQITLPAYILSQPCPDRLVSK